MKTYIVKAVIMRMGRTCASCRQNYEIELKADSADDAVARAKVSCGADLETHKFKVSIVKEI